MENTAPGVQRASEMCIMRDWMIGSDSLTELTCFLPRNDDDDDGVTSISKPSAHVSGIDGGDGGYSAVDALAQDSSGLERLAPGLRAT